MDGGVVQMELHHFTNQPLGRRAKNRNQVPNAANMIPQSGK